jgi:hypothetical protein
MAAITELTPSPGSKPGGLYESIAIVNLADTSVVSKAIRTPSFARYVTFLVDLTAVGGTAPKFDFVVLGYNPAANSFAAPDDGFLFSLGWDGITQKTAASQATVVIGPDITTDDTGSATADDFYGVNTVLPDWLVYKYTLDGAAVGDDQDYTATISAFFRGV